MKPRNKELGNRNLIGQHVVKLRMQQGMSQKELMARMQAFGVDINYASLSKLEGQTRSATDKEIVAIAHILGITPNDLLMV